MKQGDFTKLAKSYVNRPGYSSTVLTVLTEYIDGYRDNFRVADLGAGTGKLTESLLTMGLKGFAVEPNDAMRAEGIITFGQNDNIVWCKGSAEETGLEESSVDWVLMASSFHWTETEKALVEFYRILKPGGFFTALWNPRDLERSEFYLELERKIHDIVPEIKRVSSGGKKYTQGLEQELVSTGHFEDVFFLEAPHEVVMSKDRYMGAWRSVNDIQAQAGKERFDQILRLIEQEIRNLDNVIVPYNTRAWTVRSRKYGDS